MQRFADAGASLEEARAVIFGIPFQQTVSFRKGTAKAPEDIREESYNFEIFQLEHGIDLAELKIHDALDLDGLSDVDAMLSRTETEARRLSADGRFLVGLGGEHSVSEPLVKAFGKINVLILDAHLDFRHEYEGERHSHACAARRIADIVGTDRIYQIGIRSGCKEEYEDAKSMGLHYASASEVREKGIEAACDKAAKHLGKGPLYLSIDIDAVDPAYAPGTGTPEPWGITSWDAKYVVDRFAPSLTAMDVVEVCPAYDNGNTSSLAAKMVREAIGLRLTKGK